MSTSTGRLTRVDRALGGLRGGHWGPAAVRGLVWGLLALVSLVLVGWCVRARVTRARGRTGVRARRSPAGRPAWRVAAGLCLALGWQALAPAAGQAQTPTETVDYYHLDALGSVRVVTNAAAQVVARHDFLPFGEEYKDNLSPARTDRKLFTGQEHDPETGLDYFGARYYGATIGRFTTADPAMTVSENLVDP